MLISSDTNVWLDFEYIKRLHHPFLLEHSYYLSNLTYEEEIQQSEAIRKAVADNLLQITNVPYDELALASEYAARYPAITFYDAVAMSIAKCRGWILLTGDGALRNAAKQEKVECHGTIWVYDELKKNGLITLDEFRSAMTDLLQAVKEGKRRLPQKELIIRIDGCL